MKKTAWIYCLIFTTALLGACDKNESDITQEIEFTLDFTFIESGNMTRATGEDVYGQFYNNYIKTKILTPATYELTFTNTKTGDIADINGLWASKNGIRLPEGTYTVKGTSHRKYNDALDLHSEYISDTTFISFNEEIHLTTDQTVLELTAQYDSYLLLFDATNISNIEYEGLKRWQLKTYDNLKVLFINRQSTLSTKNDCIKITRIDGTSITIHLKNIPFEVGKYYYFNDMTNSFDIPKMDSGN